MQLYRVILSISVSYPTQTIYVKANSREHALNMALLHEGRIVDDFKTILVTPLDEISIDCDSIKDMDHNDCDFVFEFDQLTSYKKVNVIKSTPIKFNCDDGSVVEINIPNLTRTFLSELANRPDAIVNVIKQGEKN